MATEWKCISMVYKLKMRMKKQKNWKEKEKQIVTRIQMWNATTTRRNANERKLYTMRDAMMMSYRREKNINYNCWLSCHRYRRVTIFRNDDDDDTKQPV